MRVLILCFTAWFVGCAVKVQPPPVAASVAASESLAGRPVALLVEAPDRTSIGTSPLGPYKSAQPLTPTLTQRVRTLSRQFGLSPNDSAGLQLVVTLATFRVDKDPLKTSNLVNTSVSGQLQLLDERGSQLFSHRFYGGTSHPKKSSPSKVFEDFDASVVESLAAIDVAIKEGPDLGRRIADVPAARSADTPRGPVRDPEVNAQLEKARRERRRRPARIVLGTTLGYASAFGALAGFTALTRDADLGAGRFPAELGLVILATPVGPTLAGAALDGQGSYGWALAGSSAAIVGALGAPTTGDSLGEITTAGIIGAALAPLTSVAIYEVRSAVKGSQMERQATFAGYVSPRPDGATVVVSATW